MLISSDWLKIKLSCSNCCTLTDLVLFDLETPKYIYSVVHVPAQHILLFGMCAASTESYCICQKTAYFIICSWMQELLYCFRLLYIYVVKLYNIHVWTLLNLILLSIGWLSSQRMNWQTYFHLHLKFELDFFLFF